MGVIHKKKGCRIKVAEAAKALEMDEQLLRIWMQRGKIDIGYAEIGTGKQYYYYILPEKLIKLGVEIIEEA